MVGCRQYKMGHACKMILLSNQATSINTTYVLLGSQLSSDMSLNIVM